MKSPVEALTPGVSPEFLALNSLAIACSSADRYLSDAEPGMTAAQQKSLLEESVFFHHFMALIAICCVFDQDLNFRNEYSRRMVAAINPGLQFPTNEEFGLAPLMVFTAKDRQDAIRSCFFSPANLVACLHSELYLGRKPSESELKVMNLKTVREMTGWDAPSANPMQFFAAAFIARLTITLKIEPRERFLDFMHLSGSAVAESRAAFKLYAELLGAEVLVSGRDTKVPEPPRPKGTWRSKLFK